MTTAVMLVLEDVHLDHARLRELALGLSPGPGAFGCLRARLGLARLRLGLLLRLSVRLALGLVRLGLGVFVLRGPPAPAQCPMLFANYTGC